jgi:predicted O-linked N-acetylglucosamine transferase (SPINDLY family)
MPQEGNCESLVQCFAQEGIAPERLRFHGRSDMDRLHHQVDICLDTFPYGGSTTTIHALWMGVPTLTIAGGTVTARLGAGICAHVGLDAFVAQDAEDFVRKGLSWTSNLTELAEIRMGLRERFTGSAIGQPALVAEGVLRALRLMWRRWCEGLPPVTLDVSDRL